MNLETVCSELDRHFEVDPGTIESWVLYVIRKSTRLATQVCVGEWHFTCFEDGEAAIVKRTKGGAEAVRILIRQSTAESRVMGIPCFELEYLGGRAVL